MRGEGREWPARVRSGGGPSAPATGLENSLRMEFEGNSGIVLKVLCVVSSKFCEYHLPLPRIGCKHGLLGLRRHCKVLGLRRHCKA